MKHIGISLIIRKSISIDTNATQEQTNEAIEKLKQWMEDLKMDRRTIDINAKIETQIHPIDDFLPCRSLYFTEDEND